jgi:hypothetical protein
LPILLVMCYCSLFLSDPRFWDCFLLHSSTQMLATITLGQCISSDHILQVNRVSHILREVWGCGWQVKDPNSVDGTVFEEWVASGKGSAPWYRLCFTSMQHLKLNWSIKFRAFESNHPTW